MFDSVAVGVVVELEARGESPPPGREAEVLRVVRLRVLDDARSARACWFVNVQVTVSPALTEMFETGLPSSQVALARSQPAGTVSDTE